MHLYALAHKQVVQVVQVSSGNGTAAPRLPRSRSIWDPEMENPGKWQHHPSDWNNTKTLQLPAAEIGLLSTFEPQHVCVCCIFKPSFNCRKVTSLTFCFANPTTVHHRFVFLSLWLFEQSHNVAQYHSQTCTWDHFGIVPPILSIISATSQASVVAIHPDLLLI